MSVIIDTQHIAEGLDEDEAPVEDMAATETSDPTAKMEFHVQMRSWTMRDMEELIVQAAATQLIGGFRDQKINALIEDRAIASITAKADDKIAGITAEIIDQPLTPKFGEREPVTMREFIGLYAKEYLTETVDIDGKPSKGGYARNTYTRAELSVMKYMDRTFKAEIEKQTSAVTREIQSQIKAAHDAFLEQEKTRLREAIEKVTK
jgi:hypothetical protein